MWSTRRHEEEPPWTAGEVEWIISTYITRADIGRREWLQIISALVYSFGPEKATEIMLRHFPDEQKRETERAANGALRARPCSLGTVFELARRFGGFDLKQFWRARKESFR